MDKNDYYCQKFLTQCVYYYFYIQSDKIWDNEILSLTLILGVNKHEFIGQWLCLVWGNGTLHRYEINKHCQTCSVLLTSIKLNLGCLDIFMKACYLFKVPGILL